MKSFAPNQYSPFEIGLSILFGISGMAQLFVGPPVGSSSALLPLPFRVIWLIMMIVGCLLTLWGVSVDKVWGYIVERIGLLATGWSITIFGLAILYVQLMRGNFTPSMIIGGPLTMGLGIMFLAKARQVRRILRSLESK